MERQPRFFVSADWSKDPRKRSVYVADLNQRHIYREARPDWSLRSLMALARELPRQGSVLIGIDLVLGVPRSYWRLTLSNRLHRPPVNFVDWLMKFSARDEFFDPSRTVKNHGRWRVDRPWFEVQRGEGGLTSFTQRTRDGFLRRIDQDAGAKPVFAVSGIPGTVGSATRAFWRELTHFLGDERNFAIWPFDGPLSDLLDTDGIVLAETYPGLAYGAALAEKLPTARIRITKTGKQHERDHACDTLATADWVNTCEADLGDDTWARGNDDDFDAHLTAAAVLRCYLAGTPLVDEEWIDQVAEGSMLLAGPVDPVRKSKALSTLGERPIQAGLRLETPGVPTPNPKTQRPQQSPVQQQTDYPCPISGCTKVFHDSRGGWDTHVASHRKHPDWYPDIKSPRVRKELFRRDFGNWFL